MSSEATTCALSQDRCSVLLLAHRNSEKSLALWDVQQNSVIAFWDTAHTKDIEACSLFLLRKSHSSSSNMTSSPPPPPPFSAPAATIIPPAQAPTAGPGLDDGVGVVAADDDAAVTVMDVEERASNFNPTEAVRELNEPKRPGDGDHYLDHDNGDDDDTDSGYEVHDHTYTTLEDDIVIESNLLAVSACSEKICVWDSEAHRQSGNRLLLNVRHHGGATAGNYIVWCHLTTLPHCESLKLIAVCVWCGVSLVELCGAIDVGCARAMSRIRCMLFCNS